jgi:benzoylformate decarboxylase
LPFPTSHPLWNGSLPTKATEIRARLSAFDAVIALGGHSLITYPYSEGPALPPTCRLFQLSADAQSLGRIYSTALSCVGDIKASLRALLPIVSRKITPHRAERAHTTRRAELQRRAEAEMDVTAITPLAAAFEVTRAIGSRAAIVDESPVTMEYVRSALRTVSSRQYFFMRSAILGWGMPAAVGVSLGLDREPVVSLVGDGSSLYSPQALWTAAREQLPVTFVVMNNCEYNILKNYMRAQEHYAGARAGRFIGMDLIDPAIDFLALAASMGVPALRVERASEIAGAVENGIASGRPNLIEVRIGAAATTH